MDLPELVLGAYLTFFGGGVAALFWSRMNRIEERMVAKEDLAAFREEMAIFRKETQDGFIRSGSEMAIMRSDLTHVALAVGAKPRASEG